MAMMKMLRDKQAATFPTGTLDFCGRDTDILSINEIKSRVQLNIIIVGAGLGGLSTAIALRQRGHRVTVFEQAIKLGEVGILS
jgi:salicylate hydroxylase